MKTLTAIMLVLFTMTVFAQTAPPTYLDSALKAIGLSGGTVASILVVFELILRAVPTAKPLSVLIPVQYAFAGFGAILSFLGDLTNKLIGVANNVQPPK